MIVKILKPIRMKLQRAAYDGCRNLTELRKYFRMKKDTPMNRFLSRRPLSAVLLLDTIIEEVDVSELCK